jgi:hypothetical protein
VTPGLTWLFVWAPGVDVGFVVVLPGSEQALTRTPTNATPSIICRMSQSLSFFFTQTSIIGRLELLSRGFQGAQGVPAHTPHPAAFGGAREKRPQ